MIARDEDGLFATYVWPGGYPIYHLTHDGGVLCPGCANKYGHSNDPDPSWRITDSDINWEDKNLLCDNCGERIESAYAEEEGR